MIFALAGNQNCGKTTLFNQLTGSNQHVGNFPGVTVEQKEGIIRGYKDCSVVDLPGIYSLSPYTNEEIVTRDFLVNNKPDCIINIVDAMNIERNLYLSLQLIDLNIPMVIALNMMDEVKSNGYSIDINKIRERIGIPIVAISASKNQGIDELIETVIRTAKSGQKPKVHDFCVGAVHRAIHSTAILIEDHAQRVGVAPRFAATKLIEGDYPMIRLLDLSENEVKLLGHTVSEMEAEVGTDREAALADMRYDFIDKLCSKTVVKCSEVSKQHLRSIKIDRVLTNKYLAIPIFLAVMLIVFWLTFGVIGSALSVLLSKGIDWFTEIVDAALTSYDINETIHSLIIDGIFAGVGSVLSFLPIIVVLFFFLSILEDTGYMARVAFVMDKALRKIGLSGRSFVPMLVGFGCSVPAIMATRTLASERDRRMTIMLVPFMSCSAKLPVYAAFTYVFFTDYQALVMMSLYVLGILVGIISGVVLNKTVFKGSSVSFVMELPNYRLPSKKSIGLMMWDKAKDFLQRAFTVIFIATLIIWFLQSFDIRLDQVEDAASSILAQIGKLILPLLRPLGFEDWRISTALITGFTAKEAVISTFAVLTGTNTAHLSASLANLFTPLSAYSFLVFCLLYTPCIAAIAAVKNELKSVKAAAFMVVFQTGIAWIMAFIFYRVGALFIN